MPATIQIRQYTFEITTPYTQGVICGQREADALNSLRAENIRNNLAKKLIKQLSESPGGFLTPEQLTEFTQTASEYDTNYQFPLRGAPAPKRGTLESEIEAVAEERANAELRGRDPSPADLAAAIEGFRSTPAVQSEARRRLQARADVGLASLESLL